MARLIADSILAMASETREKHPSLDHFWVTYFVAGTIIGKFLGSVWLERHVLGTTAPTDFFRNDVTSRNNEDLHFLRVVHLAEMLVNLSAVSGFRKVRTMLAGGDIEGAFTELEVGKLLAWNNSSFRFVEPQGIKKRDFDIELMHNNTAVCIDVKCKVEATARSVKTLRSSLDGARSQLPADKPGAIFVKTPQSWNLDGTDDSLVRDLKDAAEDFLRGTERIVSVVFYSSLALDFGERTVGIVLLKEFSNKKHRHGQHIDWTLMGTVSQPPSWLDLILLSAGPNDEVIMFQPRNT